MDKPRPYLIAALFCENVIEEKNGALTLIRIADRIEVQPEGLPPGMKPIIQIKGLVSMKSGPVVGDIPMKLMVTRPNGEQKEVMTFTMKFLGNDQGQNVILHMSLGADEYGLYWFDLLLEDKQLTRIPLMLVQAEKPAEKKV